MNQLLAGEVYGKAKQYGLNNGYGIGIDNVSEFGEDEFDRYMEECSTHESDGFRQYSPFERFASMLNSQSDFVRERAWDIYDKWVGKGLEEAWNDFYND